jgi:hypothetical protein
MARINTYEKDSEISLNDKLLGTDKDDSLKSTKNYTVESLKNFILEGVDVNIQNNIPLSITLNPIFSPTPNSNTLIDASELINNLDEFTINSVQIPFFTFIRGEKIYILSFQGIGKGTYGLNTEPLEQSNLQIISEKPITLNSLLELSNTSVINLFNIGSSEVNDVVNLINPAIDLKPITDGFTIFKATQNGEQKNWLYLGDSGLVGLGNYQTGIEDFNEIVDFSILNHSELNLNDGTNPHGTTANDLGLENVDNTSDLDKPISNATLLALSEIDQSKWEIEGTSLKVPTEDEWEAERLSWSTNDANGAFNSPLKLTLSGGRDGQLGEFSFVDTRGIYWSSTKSEFNSYSVSKVLYFVNNSVPFLPSDAFTSGTLNRTSGLAVRLIIEGAYTQQEFENNYENKTIKIDGLTYGYVYNPTTQRIWIDRNLGATQVATSLTDADAYGDSYQWGRPADGHEKRDSLTHDGNTLGKPSTSTESGDWDGKFITTTQNPNDWIDPQDDTLWQDPLIDNRKLIGKDGLKASYEDLDDKPTIPTLISNHSELNLDDGTNPHGTTASDVGLGNVLNVEQYPATNPSGFETPAQLDARDTANRDRANHTGTQAISTVSGLLSELNSKAKDADISVVGKSNDYEDLDNKPTLISNHSQLNLDDGTNPHGTTAIDVGVGWTSLSTQWSVEPSQIGTTVDGDVYEYTLLGTTRYRLVPSPYDPTLDAFYADWDGTDLSNLIISRG